MAVSSPEPDRSRVAEPGSPEPVPEAASAEDLRDVEHLARQPEPVPETAPAEGLRDVEHLAREPDTEPVHPVRDDAPMDETLPGNQEAANGSVDVQRICWSLTTVACLIAMVILGLRGDIGYAGVTLAVAIAAAINLF